ncbi:M48 family metallopeptidase [Qipengyuania flava]|uniref:M48 family metallopeptidase n=1 Tax=Qipengyuania flava TaxID=192812 RepID=UPI001C637652|nr:M48 family metallopeptidase [Qipengyuania flava]QYJ07977.1 M48 family metalloprotease [Qipengyuania flava]
MRKLCLAAGAAAMALQPLAAAASDTAVADAVAAADPLPELYQPQDDLERGLWLRMDEYERDLKSSRQVIHDPELNAYVRSVLCKMVGEAECQNIRLYISHTPHFNATMAPNGVMQVWSGLLLRTQNEAQLATVLAHEYAHFRQRHGVKLFREAKEKSNTAAWLAFTGIGLIASIAIAGSIFKFSREQEQEADLGGLALLDAAGYDTSEAAVLWQQLINEEDATRLARGKKKKRKAKAGMFDTHPANQQRIDYLREAAAGTPGTPGQTGLAEYQRAMRNWWPVFLDDQLKMNDDGASTYLLDSMINANGSTPWLEFGRGELARRKGTPEALEAAVSHYSAAIAAGGDLPELWRGRGLALKKLGQPAAAKADLEEYLVRAPEAADHAMISMISGGIQ